MSKVIKNNSVVSFVVFLVVSVVTLPQIGQSATQVSQFGITWTFDKDYQVGQFANGDYWVIGPVTIIGINPPSTDIGGRIKNGAMVNPSPTNINQGFDNGFSAFTGVIYDPSLNKAFNVSSANPLVLPVSSSLVSTISIDAAAQRPQLKTAAILTVLASAPPSGSFRPPYVGTDKTIKFNKSNLDYSKLAKLEPTTNTPRLKQQSGDAQGASVERMFERPWLDYRPYWSTDYMHPSDNMPNYGRDMADQVGTAALALHLNYSDADKETLMIRFVQLGIDLYGIVTNGGQNNWPGDAGIFQGRKWPILFAGIVLNDPDMKTIGTTTVLFGEDLQTFYVAQSDVDIATQRGGPCNMLGHHDGDCADQGDYLQGDIGLPEWGIRHSSSPFEDDRNWDSGTKSAYRRCCTGNSFVGYVLAAHIMNAKALWNHDALFDYQDRYMAVEASLGNTGAWYRSWSKFPGEMWDRYRANYGCVWTQSNPSDIYSNGSNSCDSNNQAPVLQSIGNKSVNENALLTFTISATDADDDTLIYSAQNLPSGATLASQTFSWTPSYTQAGTYSVTFRASDGRATDSETIVITVNNTNRAPVLAAIGNKSVNENSTLSFSISATDADGDTITYSAQNLPSGAAFAGRTFTWTPSYTQAGTYQVTFIASDGQAQVSKTITITVNNVNQAPVLSSIGNKSAYANDLLAFSVSATEPDGDTITYSVTGLPSGATFTSQSFSWTPAPSQAGTYQVTFIASDGQLQDSEAITITVYAADTSAPTVSGLSPAADSIQAPLNSLVILHITDSGKGVDANSVTIKVNSNTIYTGNTADYSSSYGHCRRTGTEADYTFVYQPNSSFDYDQTETVVVNAGDLAGNTMSQYSYSFTTEMRSFGQNKKVNSGSDGLNKGHPATVRDSTGSIWAAWHAGPAGSRDIYVGKLTVGEDAFDTSVQVTNNSTDQCNAAIAIDASDKLYLVWQDNQRGNWDIYISTSTDGTNWSAEKRVTDSNNNEVNPVVAVDHSSTPKAYIAWQDDRAGNQEIYIASSSNGFTTVTTSRITSDSSDQISPAIAVNTANTIYVVWADSRNGSSDIYGAASNSGPWTNVPIVTKSANQTSPAIATEATGTVLHMLWVDDIAGNKDIYYATSNGLPSAVLTGRNVVDDSTGTDQLAPAIITTGSTGAGLKVFTCWQDERNAASGGDTDLYFVEVNSGSGTNIFVGDDATNSNQAAPAIGIDKYGYPYLVWVDDRNQHNDIYYAGSNFVRSTALASQTVSPSSSATIGTDPANITSVDDVSIVVPAGAYPCELTITITKVENPPKLTVPLFSASYEFGPSGTNFDKPVTITIPYSVSASGGEVSAYWYNTLVSALSQQGITDVETIVISSTLHALRFKTTHFTQFLVGGAGESGSGGGGGGCALSSPGQASFTEFMLPYIGLAAVMTIINRRDKRNQERRSATGNEH